MGTPLDQQTVNRLAFCRHLLDNARRSAARPEPFSSEGLLEAHDATELYLVLCAEHLDVSLPKNIQFDGYWSEIETHGKITLPLRGAMQNLNKARVALKHHFQHPARSDLGRHLTRTAQFFEEATPIVFNVDLDDVSLASLVRDPNVRRWIARAEDHRVTNETEALASCVMAHRAAVAVYQRARWGRSTPFDAPFLSVSLDWDACKIADEVESFASEVADALQSMSSVVETLALGLDVDRLEQLRRHWPNVAVRGGRLDISNKSTFQAEDRPAGVVEASIAWVTEAALQLQERATPLN